MGDLSDADQVLESDQVRTETLCPYYKWEWSDSNEGPRRFHPAMAPGIYDKYFFRGPYSSDCVWNHLTSGRSEPSLSGGPWRRLTWHEQTGPGHAQVMARVLSISRLLESRCQSLFAGLIEAQRWAQDEAAKKMVGPAKTETDSLLAEAQETLQKATAKLQSISVNTKSSARS